MSVATPVRTRQNLHRVPAQKAADPKAKDTAAKEAAAKDAAAKEGAATPAKAETTPGKTAQAQKAATAKLNVVREGKLTLKQGDRGESVRQAQTLLNDAAGAGLKLDGKFGDKTEAAVTNFQRAQKLEKVDGKIGPETMGALDRVVAQKARAQSGAESASDRLPVAADGSRAENGIAAKSGAADGSRAENMIAARQNAARVDTQRQEQVQKPAEKTTTPVKLGLTGLTKKTETELNAAIEQAVKEMLGKAMASANDDTAAKGDAAASKTAKADATTKADTPAYIGPTIRDGSTGPAVTAMQGRLKELGYEVEADGKFGPKTESAIKKFQTTLDIKVDGIVGPETYGKLNMDPSKAAKVGAAMGRVTTGNVDRSTLGTGAKIANDVSAVNQAAGGSTRLGNGRSTLRGAGCMLAAYGMAAQAVSGKTKGMGVSKLNQLVKNNSGFSGSSLRGPTAARAMGMTQTGRSTISRSNAQSKAAQIDKSLAEGKPVVLGVDYKAGSRGSGRGTGVDHWITVTGKNADGSYTALDPAGGRKITLKPDANGVLRGGSKNYVGREMITFNKR